MISGKCSLTNSGWLKYQWNEKRNYQQWTKGYNYLLRLRGWKNQKKISNQKFISQDWHSKLYF